MIAFFPIVIPGRIVAFAPIEDPSLSKILENLFGLTLDLGYLSFDNVAFGPMNTLFSTVVPSQRYTPHFIVTLSPIMTSFSTNVWGI